VATRVPSPGGAGRAAVVRGSEGAQVVGAVDDLVVVREGAAAVVGELTVGFAAEVDGVVVGPATLGGGFVVGGVVVGGAVVGGGVVGGFVVGGAVGVGLLVLVWVGRGVVPPVVGRTVVGRDPEVGPAGGGSTPPVPEAAGPVVGP
jgi:hypothetical protein